MLQVLYNIFIILISNLLLQCLYAQQVNIPSESAVATPTQAQTITTPTPLPLEGEQKQNENTVTTEIEIEKSNEISNIEERRKENLLKKMFGLVKRRYLDTTFTIGTVEENYGKWQTTRDGDRNKDLKIRPYIEAGSTFAISKNFAFIPEIGLIWPTENSDTRIRKTVYIIRSDFAYLIKTVSIRIGASIFITSITGRGNRVTTNNGNSTTMFWTPNENSSSLNQSLDGGLEFFSPFSFINDKFYNRFSIRMSGHLIAPFNDQRRSTTLMLGVSYHLEKLSRYQWSNL